MIRREFRRVHGISNPNSLFVKTLKPHKFISILKLNLPFGSFMEFAVECVFLNSSTYQLFICTEAHKDKS